MKLKKVCCVICFWAVFGIQAWSQADISMATHWYNRGSYNPASIARTDYIYLFANVRRQWLGVDGAPTVLNVQASEYVHSLRSAFGLSIVSDNVGVSQLVNPMLTYAYRMANEQYWSVSLGISAGVLSRSVDGSLFQSVSDDDPALYNDMEHFTKPDVNVGIEVEFPYLMVGFASTHLLAVAPPENLYMISNHRYGYVIYKNTDSELINFSAGLQVVNRNTFTVMEGNANIRFKRPTGLTAGPHEIFDLGMAYRSTKQLTFLVGVNLSPTWRVGYAFDQSFIAGYNQNSTHEIMLEYRIPSPKSSTCIQCRNTDYWYR